MKEKLAKLPVNEHKIFDVELWLEQMAFKGFFLTETVGSWWYFEKREPDRVLYRLAPIDGKRGECDEARQKEYLKNGWRYVTTHRTLYHILRADDPDTAEFYTNSKLQEMALKWQEKRLMTAAVATVLCIGVFLFNIRDFLAGIVKSPFLTLAEPEMIALIGIMPLAVFLIVRVVENWRYTKNMRRLLEKGVCLGPDEEQVRTKKFPRWSKYIFTLLVLLAAVCLFSSCGQGGPVAQELGYGDTFVALELLEEAGIPEEAKYCDGDVIYYHNPFMREQYEVRQTAEIEPKEGKAYTAKLRVHFYNSRMEDFAEGMERELEEQAKRQMEQRFSRLQVEGFNTFLWGAQEEMQLLIAREGTKVLFMEYQGRLSLPEKAEALLHLMNKEKP